MYFLVLWPGTSSETTKIKVCYAEQLTKSSMYYITTELGKLAILLLLQRFVQSGSHKQWPLIDNLHVSNDLRFGDG